MTCKCKMQPLLLKVCDTIFGTQFLIRKIRCIWKLNTHLARSPCNIVVWSTAFVRVIICRIICWIIYYVYSSDFAVFSFECRSIDNSCNFDLWYACNALLSYFFGRSQYISKRISASTMLILTKEKHGRFLQRCWFCLVLYCLPVCFHILPSWKCNQFTHFDTIAAAQRQF